MALQVMEAFSCVSRCTKEEILQPSFCLGEEEEVINESPAMPQMPPMLTEQPVQEKYWDLASVPGYDPSFLVGWRLSHVWTKRERQGPEENSLAEGAQERSSSVPQDSRTRHFTRAAVQRMGPLVLCPELSCKDCSPMASLHWASESWKTRRPQPTRQEVTEECKAPDVVEMHQDRQDLEPEKVAAEVSERAIAPEEDRGLPPRRHSQRSLNSDGWTAERQRRRRRSTCSVNSITSSCATSCHRSVLNLKAVLMDLDGSEEHEYGRLLPVLFDIQRETKEPCIWQFPAENCDVNAELLDALPFLRHLEDPDFELPENFRQTSIFQHFLIVLRELSVSDTTCERLWRNLIRDPNVGRGRQRAQQLCIERFQANLPWQEWEEILSASFEGDGRLSYTSWALGCRRAVRIVRLMITLRMR